MEDGVMAMEFPSLPHLMPGMDTMAMAVDTMVDIMVDTTDILMAMATDIVSDGGAVDDVGLLSVHGNVDGLVDGGGV